MQDLNRTMFYKAKFTISSEVEEDLLLAIYMKPIFEEGYSDPYKEFQQKTGIKCARGEGSMTRKDKVLMRQFSCDYKGTQFNIEPHITFPSQKQSI